VVPGWPPRRQLREIRGRQQPALLARPLRRLPLAGDKEASSRRAPSLPVDH
jgi:hypothetical protein